MTRYALVPVEGTKEICDALVGDRSEGIEWDVFGASFQADWTAAIAASPGGGRVTAEMVEKITRAICKARGHGLPPGPPFSPYTNDGFHYQDGRRDALAALAALGLQVEGDGQEGEG